MAAVAMSAAATVAVVITAVATMAAVAGTIDRVVTGVDDRSVSAD